VKVSPPKIKYLVSNYLTELRQSLGECNYDYSVCACVCERWKRNTDTFNDIRGKRKNLME